VEKVVQQTFSQFKKNCIEKSLHFVDKKTTNARSPSKEKNYSLLFCNAQ